ncbi:C-terminal dimerization domain [Abeliophyllum distichum]|uniref:C-terminal dimerization domain n=1 Tax=Abeliophyllum distichum TaxID=126358 RepID=A0ABD1NS22_9LAMI
MARDLLTVPVSTVASESAFSTVNRALDERRSRLKEDILEALRHSESNEEIMKRLAEIEVKLQSNEEILKCLAEIEAKVESNDIILKRLTDIESKIQSNEEIQNRLAKLEMKVQYNIQIEKQIKELEEKVKSNEKFLKRVANVESKVNDLQMLKTICTSSSKTCEIDVNDDDVELKDEDWQKIDEIAAVVLAKHKLEEVIVFGDCRIYVIKYAEYFINEMLKEMPKIFNIAQVRKHLATQLYVYAKKKQVENYDTDNDWVPKDV